MVLVYSPKYAPKNEIWAVAICDSGCSETCTFPLHEKEHQEGLEGNYLAFWGPLLNRRSTASQQPIPPSMGTGVSCKSGTFSLITYYIPLYHILVTGHPYHIRTPRYILDNLLFIIEIGNHEHSWTFMNIHEHSWTFMNHHQHSWTVMNIHELSWTFMNIHEHSWTVINIHEHSWTFMNYHAIIQSHHCSWCYDECLAVTKHI